MLCDFVASLLLVVGPGDSGVDGPLVTLAPWGPQPLQMGCPEASGCPLGPCSRAPPGSAEQWSGQASQLKLTQTSSQPKSMLGFRPAYSSLQPHTRGCPWQSLM